MPRPTSNRFLPETLTLLRRMQSKVERLDGNLVAQDIAARRQEALIGFEFARRYDKIEADLKTLRSSLTVAQWCKQNIGCDISTMRRRKRLHKHWRLYETKRRAIGATGQCGLLYALFLVKDGLSEAAMDVQPMHLHSAKRTVAPNDDASVDEMSGCRFITGDALVELAKLPASSVNVVVTSPPYWPTSRAYSGVGIGFEKSIEDYLDNLVKVFHEVQRVLRDDGVLWVSIADSYQDGNLRFLPTRLAMAMQSDRWTCRSEIVWAKQGGGRPDSVSNRPIMDSERVLMFTKVRSGYYYDGDPVRIALKNPYGVLGRKKSGIYRRDTDRTQRVWGNPLGRSCGSVWEIAPANYQGTHPATMPQELVRRCLAVSCPDSGTVLDCFSGAGTVALVAAKMGMKVINIEICADYNHEAIQRIQKELAVVERSSDRLAAD